MRTHVWKVLRQVENSSLLSPYKFHPYKIGEFTYSPTEIGLFCIKTRKRAREYRKTIGYDDCRVFKVEVDSNDLLSVDPNDLSPNTLMRTSIINRNYGAYYQMVCYSKVMVLPNH